MHSRITTENVKRDTPIETRVAYTHFGKALLFHDLVSTRRRRAASPSRPAFWSAYTASHTRRSSFWMCSSRAAIAGSVPVHWRIIAHAARYSFKSGMIYSSPGVGRLHPIALARFDPYEHSLRLDSTNSARFLWLHRMGEKAFPDDQQTSSANVVRLSKRSGSESINGVRFAAQASSP